MTRDQNNLARSNTPVLKSVNVGQENPLADVGAWGGGGYRVQWWVPGYLGTGWGYWGTGTGCGTWGTGPGPVPVPVLYWTLALSLYRYCTGPVPRHGTVLVLVP